MATSNTTIYQNLNNTEVVPQNDAIMFKELQLVILFVVLVTGAILNSALILLFMTKRRVRPRYYLLFNLAISNWIACAIVSRIIISMFLAPHYSVKVPCNVWLVIDEVWWFTQNWTIAAISFERYRKVTDPYHYARNIIYQRTYQIILAIWLLAVIAVVMLLLTPFITFKYDRIIFRCRKLWENHETYTFVYTLMSFWLPGFMVIYFYLYMCYESYKAKKNEPKPFGTGTLKRSWSLTSITSVRDFISNIQTKRRLSRSESLPNILDTNGNDVASLSGQCSIGEGTDYSGRVSRQKRNISNSKFKPFKTTLLVLIPYVTACVMDLSLIFLYSNKSYVSSQIPDMLHKFKYLLIPYFPYVLGFRDKVIKKELRKLYHSLRCWKSSQISPSPNIDSSDYPYNVSRRDSRRSSMISRRSSMLVSDEPLNSGPTSHYGKDYSPGSRKNRKIVTGCGDPMNIVIVNSPINVPVVDC